MSAPAEQRRRALRRLFRGLNLVRLLLAATLIVLSFGHDSGWRAYASSIAIALIAADTIGQAFRHRNLIIAFLGVYTVFAAIGSLLAHTVHSDRSVLWVVAVLAALSAAAALLTAAVAGARGRELDKLIFSNASSIAFFATMLVAVTYALIDNWLRVPALSPWVIVIVGGGTWVVGFVGLHRRYS